MAKTGAALPVAALAAAGVLAADRAFVSVGAPRTPAAASSAIAQAQTAGPSASFSTAGVAAAALAAGTAAIAAKSSRGNRAAARAAAADADDKEFHKHVYAQQAKLTEKFAGGLIGGESAFQSFDFNFDPLGLSTRAPYFLPWYREAELKHGRIAMLAWVGLVVPEFVRIPGPEPCYTASVIEAHQRCSGFPTDNIEDGGYYWEGPLFQIYAFCLIIELTTTLAKCTQEDGLSLENAGDYRLGINFLPDDPEKAKEMKLKELKNGRLAMLAFGGAITQAVLTGNGFPWLYSSAERSSGSLMGSSVPAMAGQKSFAQGSRGSRVATNAYKMSKAVPFLPQPPALEGYAGEEDGFDPMCFSYAYDIRWLREAELKHGRVCMLATVGWITTDLGVRVPGPMFEKISTIEAHDAMVKFGNMSQMLCWIGYLEVFGFLAIINMMDGKTDRKPGDFGIRTLYPEDERAQKDMQIKELRNGRLAMLAFSGMATVGVLTGKPWPFLAQKDDSATPTFAQGSSFCGQAQASARASVATGALPVSKSVPFLPQPKNLKGYAGEETEFDPLGFSETFDIRWLRESELKHGRVCMLACLGFFAQQWLTLPGETPTPDALKSVYTASPPALASLLFFAGYVESSSYGGKITMLDMFETDREPGNLGFGTRFLEGLSEDEEKAMRLKEIKNGRLAMMAFGGMIHHNLVVGGPLFPLIPQGWSFPEGNMWKVQGVMQGMFFNEV